MGESDSFVGGALSVPIVAAIGLLDPTSSAPISIYSMLGSNRMMQLVLDVSAMCRVPFVPHLMDHWVTTHYRENLFTPLLRQRLTRLFRALLARTSEGFTIGDAMASEYARRYGMTFTPFMNCVEPKCSREECEG